MPGTPFISPPNAAPALVPAHATLDWERLDEGVDGRTNPGGPLLALGDGEVIQVGRDTSTDGFGLDYPVIHFTSGVFAGQDVYYGHSHSALQVGDPVHLGDVVAHTGTTANPGTAAGSIEPGHF
jgi:murein DD-endopeptidase MepM/ murein hydrolase activator NlpD